MTAKKPRIWVRLVQGYEHDPAKAYPLYYYIVLGGDFGNTRLIQRSKRLFSKETALESLAHAEKEFGLKGTDALRIRLALSDTNLPVNKSRADQLMELKVSEDVAHEDMFEHVLGIIPPEEGAGPAHVRICKDECGFEGCKKFPCHAAIFVNGVAKPVAIAFSAASATYHFEVSYEKGLYDKKELKAVRKMVSGLVLPVAETRSDHLLRNGYVDYLDFIHGLRAPDQGSGEARFERCGDHGHLHVRGSRNFDVLVASVASGVAWIKRLADKGLYSEQEVATVHGQLMKSGLPAAHPSDAEYNEPEIQAFGKAIRRMFSLMQDAEEEAGAPAHDCSHLPN